MVYFPIDDPYLLLYLSSFLTVRDFIHLYRTSRLFADDPLITDELAKRIRNNISARFISLTNDQIYTDNVAIHEFSDKTALVFSIPPVPMLELTQDVPSERLSFDIRTPNWRFRWSGVLYNNVIDTPLIIQVAESPLASIQIVTSEDSGIVFIAEIRFSFARNIPNRLRRERIKWFLQMTLFAIFGSYILFGSNELIIRIELVVYGMITGYYLTRNIPTGGNLVPCPTYT